jgi:hypothetical protein
MSRTAHDLIPIEPLFCDSNKSNSFRRGSWVGAAEAAGEGVIK